MERKISHLEDFIVKSLQKIRVGSALFETTLKHKIKIKWCVGRFDWNTPTINFYNKYGAEISSTWLTEY